MTTKNHHDPESFRRHAPSRRMQEDAYAHRRIARSSDSVPAIEPRNTPKREALHLLSDAQLEKIDGNALLHSQFSRLFDTLSHEYALMHGDGVPYDAEAIYKTSMALQVVSEFLETPARRRRALLTVEPLAWALDYATNSIFLHDKSMRNDIAAIKDTLDLPHHVSFSDEALCRMEKRYDPASSSPEVKQDKKRRSGFSYFSAQETELLRNDAKVRESVGDVLIAVGNYAHLNSTPQADVKEALLAVDILSNLDAACRIKPELLENKEAASWALGFAESRLNTQEGVQGDILSLRETLGLPKAAAHLDRLLQQRLCAIAQPEPIVISS